jgi:hypothetical protein
MNQNAQDHAYVIPYGRRLDRTGTLLSVFIGKNGEITGVAGYTNATHLATAEKGRLYLQTIISSVSAWLV